jgi:translation elongation factor P/translation initiation factor 5A
MKHIKVELLLEVENNNKFVRGRKRSIEEIEKRVLSRYNMKKIYKDGEEYELTIPYEDYEELDDIIYGMLDEASKIAYYRHCFIESDVRDMDSDRSW